MSDRMAGPSTEIETIDESGIMIFFDREKNEIPSFPASIALENSVVHLDHGECGLPRYLFGIDHPSLSNATCIRLKCESTGLIGLRAEVAAAMRLCERTGCLAVGRASARTAMGLQYFKSVASQWLMGGAFPALGLTALHIDDIGVVHSVGMRMLTGWEVAVPPALGMTKAEQAKIAIRFVDDIIRNGPPEYDQDMKIDGLGEIHVQPNFRGNIVYLLR